MSAALTQGYHADGDSQDAGIESKVILMAEIEAVLRGQLELELEAAIDTVMAKYGISFQTADTDLAETILTIAESIPRG